MKPSKMFLILFFASALLAAYQAMFPVTASIAFTRFLGLEGFMLVCMSMMIGPLMVLRPLEYAPLVEPRRAVGLASFFIIALHIFLATALEYEYNLAGELNQFPIFVAVPAALIFLALALTSSDVAIHKLGVANWKTLQRFVYLAFILSFSHFLQMSTGLLTTTPSGLRFVNLSEVAMVLLGFATIGLQIAGFMAKRKRVSAPSTNPVIPAQNSPQK